MTGLPELFITAGGNELLLDDAALLAAHVQRDGVKTTFKIYPGMSHDWTILLPEKLKPISANLYTPSSANNVTRDTRLFAFFYLGKVFLAFL